MLGFPEKYDLAKKFFEENVLNPAEGVVPVQLKDTEKLCLYALGQQADHGPCDHPAPSMWNLTEYYKHSAWSSLGSLSRMEAMVYYTQQLDEKCPGWTTRVSLRTEAELTPGGEVKIEKDAGNLLPTEVPALQSLVVELRKQISRLTQENEELRKKAARTQNNGTPTSSVASVVAEHPGGDIPNGRDGGPSVVVRSDGTYYTELQPRMGWLQWLGLTNQPTPTETEKV